MKLTLMERFRKLKNVKNSILDCDKFYEEKKQTERKVDSRSLGGEFKIG